MAEQRDSGTESVADVLREADNVSNYETLLAIAEGADLHDQMDYDDWVRPMQLTDGRVCLRADKDDQREPRWFRWKSGILVLFNPGRTIYPPDSERVLKDWVEHGPEHLTPVLSEEVGDR